MRLIYFTIPVGLLFAMAGGGLLLAARNHSASPVVNVVADDWPVNVHYDHPVTVAMWKQANAEKGVSAPDFRVTDIDGQVQSLSGLTDSKPLFLFFVLDGCPCSLEAEPFYERLSSQYKNDVNFMVVTNATEEKAKKWKDQFAVPFPVVSEPHLELMNKYAVDRAVYCLLIGKDQKIIKMWPGYSQDMLQEVNKDLAAAAGVTAKPYDSSLAPKTMTSGCAFPNAKS